MKDINIKSLSAIRYFNTTDVDNPILSPEKKAILITPTTYPEIYKQLYNDLSLFITKLNDTPAKTAVNEIYNRKLIYLMKHFSQTKRGIFGGCFFNGSKLWGIGLDVVELDIDPETGITSSIDSCFYAVYFHYIRSAVLTNVSEIKKDTSLHSDLIQYMYYLLLKAIKLNIVPKQKELLLILCSYFFYRFHLGNVHKLALENTYNTINTTLKSEIKDLVNILEKYTSINDIFKAIIDFKIDNDAPAKLMMKVLSSLKITVFYSLFSTFDYFCALAVVSKYPFDDLSTGMSMSNIQSNIEKKITPYLKTVKFDVDFFKKFGK